MAFLIPDYLAAMPVPLRLKHFVENDTFEEFTAESNIQYFYDVKTMKDATNVAREYKKKYGDVCLLEEYSRYKELFVTIMDFLDLPSEFKTAEMNLGCKFLKRAFEEAGFKRAIEIDFRDLWENHYIVDEELEDDESCYVKECYDKFVSNTIQNSFHEFMTIDCRLKILQASCSTSIQPYIDLITMAFSDVNNINDATDVAKAILLKFGKYGICYELSYNYGKIYTVIDFLETISIEDDAKQLLKQAFDAIGYKKTSELDSRILMGVYLEDDRKNNRTNYSMISRENAWISEEIAKHLYHPTKISRWIDSGKDLDDYLP